MDYGYNKESLNKHDVTCSDVNEVLAMDNFSTREFDLPSIESDNLRIMFVGYNLAGRLLEIGVEFFSEHDALYFMHKQSLRVTLNFMRKGL